MSESKMKPRFRAEELAWVDPENWLLQLGSKAASDSTLKQLTLAGWSNTCTLLYFYLHNQTIVDTYLFTLFILLALFALLTLDSIFSLYILFTLLFIVFNVFTVFTVWWCHVNLHPVPEGSYPFLSSPLLLPSPPPLLSLLTLLILLNLLTLLTLLTLFTLLTLLTLLSLLTLLNLLTLLTLFTLFTRFVLFTLCSFCSLHSLYSLNSLYSLKLFFSGGIAMKYQFIHWILFSFSSLSLRSSLFSLFTLFTLSTLFTLFISRIHGVVPYLFCLISKWPWDQNRLFFLYGHSRTNCVVNQFAGLVGRISYNLYLSL